MYCSKCGANVEENARFCNHCGANIQEVQSDSKKVLSGKAIYSIIITVICIVLSAVLIYLLTSEQNKQTISQPLQEEAPTGDAVSKNGSKEAASGFLNIEPMIFDTPESAIQYFTEKLALNDMQGVLQTCAIDEAANYNFVKALDSIGQYTIQTNWPGKYDMYQDVNKMSRLGIYALHIKVLLWSLMIPELPVETAIAKASPEGGELLQDTSLFEKRLDPSVLSTLKVEQIASSYIDPDHVEKMQENNRSFASYYGEEDMVERGVLYSYNGSYFVGGCQLLETEHGWKIYSFSAPYFGTDAMGSLTPVTMEEWEQMIE